MKITYRTKVLAVVSLLAVLVVAAVILSPATKATAATLKVDVCHVTNVPAEGDGHIISIADPAWPAHEEHGDKVIGLGAVENEDGTTCHILTGPVVPDAVDDEVTTPVETTVTIDVLANDNYDVPIFVSVQEFTQYGILGIVDVGIFEYTPSSSHPGTDSFLYQICDAGGLCDTAVVTIIVGP